MEDQPQRHAATFLSILSERDDDVTEEPFATACPALEAAQNDRHRDHVQGRGITTASKQDDDAKEEEEAYSLARDGLTFT